MECVEGKVREGERERGEGGRGTTRDCVEGKREGKL